MDALDYNTKLIQIWFESMFLEYIRANLPRVGAGQVLRGKVDVCTEILRY